LMRYDPMPHVGLLNLKITGPTVFSSGSRTLRRINLLKTARTRRERSRSGYVFQRDSLGFQKSCVITHGLGDTLSEFSSRKSMPVASERHWPRIIAALIVSKYDRHT
jgi:hypothetical protein